VLIAVVIWIAIIVYTVTTLVPINNRIARLTDRLPEGWRQEHRRWDMYHRWRVLGLVIAMACLVWGILVA
jgi:predicted PurR-regulated permease PerM